MLTLGNFKSINEERGLTCERIQRQFTKNDGRSGTLDLQKNGPYTQQGDPVVSEQTRRGQLPLSGAPFICRWDGCPSLRKGKGVLGEAGRRGSAEEEDVSKSISGLQLWAPGTHGDLAKTGTLN